MKKIVIAEGGDAAGKSNLIKALQTSLFAEHNLFVREPGGTSVGDRVRDFLNSLGEVTIGSLTEMMLLWASRFQLYEEKVLPFLLDGQREVKTVFIDRSYPSSFAYQVIGREGGIIAHDIFNTNKSALMRFIAASAEKANSTPIQIHHLWLDIDPALAAERLKHRQIGDLTQFDDFKLQQRVQGGYARFFAEIEERSAVRQGNPSEKVHRIDASASADEVYQQVLDVLKKIEVW